MHCLDDDSPYDQLPTLMVVSNQRGDIECEACEEPWEKAEVREWNMHDLEHFGVSWVPANGEVPERFYNPLRPDDLPPFTLLTLERCPCCDDSGCTAF